MSNSFYGGRDGQPFVIKKRYKTVADMLVDFKQGPDFTAINFGEYVIIDTEDRANPESGRIFRRGYDYNNSERKISQWSFDSKNNTYTEQQTEAYGAVYIGRIAGTAGTAPHFQPVPYTDEDGTEHTLDTVRGQYENETYDTISGKGSFSVKQGNLVPGKNGDTFVDEITWQHCSVIKDKNNEKSTAYIGFTFPYTVIEWDANSVSPYYHRDDAEYGENWEVITPGTSKNFNNIELVEDARAENEKGHPFYQKWSINIPKGIHGQSIENFVLTENTGLITYDLCNFDAIEEGEITPYTLNQDYPLTWITDVALDATGKLNIKTNTGENQIENQQLHWIKNISIDSDTGVVTYTDVDDSKTTNQLIYIKDASFNDTGKITLTKTDETTIEQQLDWITSAELDNDKTLTINFVNTNPITVPLRTISDMTLKDGGIFEAKFNDGDTETIGNLTDLSVSCVAAPSEDEVNEQLKTGGLWFITEEV